MHLISELSDLLEICALKKEYKMVNKKDISMIESLLFLQAINQCSGKRKASETLATSIDTINNICDELNITQDNLLTNEWRKPLSFDGLTRKQIEAVKMTYIELKRSKNGDKFHKKVLEKLNVNEVVFPEEFVGELTARNILEMNEK